MAYVLVTILEPGQRDLDNRAPAELNRHFWNMRDIIADFPTLPEPPHPEHQPGPMATGLFAPDVQLRYRLDGNMIQHALDGTLWQMQKKKLFVPLLISTENYCGTVWQKDQLTYSR